MKNENKKYDLEERLITFAVDILNLAEKLPHTRAGNHFTNQITRSGTAPSLIYGEAQSAESRKDFIHKMKMALKELRETLIAMKIIKSKPLVKDMEIVDQLQKECNELISIFVKSIQTARRNLP